MTFTECAVQMAEQSSIESPEQDEIKMEINWVIGMTVDSNVGISCTSSTAHEFAYVAGSMVVIYNFDLDSQKYALTPENTKRERGIKAVAYSSDGKYMAALELGYRLSVIVWDLVNDRSFKSFVGSNYKYECLAFTSDMRWIIVSSSDEMKIQLWDWRQGCLAFSVDAPAIIHALAVSSGSRFLTVGVDHLCLWSLCKNRVSEKLKKRPILYNKTILGTCEFIDAAYQNTHTKSDRHNYFYALDRRGHLLCLSETSATVIKWKVLGTRATAIACSSFAIAVGCSNGIVQLYQINTLNFIAAIQSPEVSYSGILNHTLKDPNNEGVSQEEVVQSKASESQVCPNIVATRFFYDESKLVCIYDDRNMFIWELGDLKSIRRCRSFFSHKSCVVDVCCVPTLDSKHSSTSRSGDILTFSPDGTVVIWNLAHISQPSKQLRTSLERELTRFKIFPPADVKRVPTSDDWPGKRYIDYFKCFCVLPEDNHVAIGDRSGCLSIFAIGDNLKCLYSHKIHYSSVFCMNCVKFEDKHAPLSKILLATGSLDRTICIVSRKNFSGTDCDEEVYFVINYMLCDGPVGCITFGQNGKMLYCITDKSISIYQITARQKDLQIEHLRNVFFENLPSVMKQVPQAKELVMGINGGIYFYHPLTDEVQRKFSTKEEVLKLALDPSGILLAVILVNAEFRLYHLPSGKLFANKNCQSEYVTRMVFTGDCKRIAISFVDGYVILWRLPEELTQEMLAHIKSMNADSREQVQCFRRSLEDDRKEKDVPVTEHIDVLSVFNDTECLPHWLDKNTFTSGASGCVDELPEAKEGKENSAGSERRDEAEKEARGVKKKKIFRIALDARGKVFKEYEMTDKLVSNLKLRADQARISGFERLLDSHKREGLPMRLDQGNNEVSGIEKARFRICNSERHITVQKNENWNDSKEKRSNDEIGNITEQEFSTEVKNCSLLIDSTNTTMTTETSPESSNNCQVGTKQVNVPIKLHAHCKPGTYFPRNDRSLEAAVRPEEITDKRGLPRSDKPKTSSKTMLELLASVTPNKDLVKNEQLLDQKVAEETENVAREEAKMTGADKFLNLSDDDFIVYKETTIGNAQITEKCGDSDEMDEVESLEDLNECTKGSFSCEEEYSNEHGDPGISNDYQLPQFLSTLSGTLDQTVELYHKLKSHGAMRLVEYIHLVFKDIKEKLDFVLEGQENSYDKLELPSKKASPVQSPFRGN